MSRTDLTASLNIPYKYSKYIERSEIGSPVAECHRATGIVSSASILEEISFLKEI
jgi:hypothetical protein